MSSGVKNDPVAAFSSEPWTSNRAEATAIPFGQQSRPRSLGLMSDDSLNPVEPPEETLGGPPQVTHAGSGVAWGAVIVLLGLALVVVFAIQNTDPVPVEFLWLDGEYPLALVILITVAVVVLFVELFGVLYRRRRRTRHSERQELRKFRETS